MNDLLLNLEPNVYTILFCITTVFVTLTAIGIISVLLKKLLMEKNLTTENEKITETSTINKKKEITINQPNQQIKTVSVWHTFGKADMPTVRYNTMKRR